MAFGSSEEALKILESRVLEEYGKYVSDDSNDVGRNHFVNFNKL